MSRMARWMHTQRMTEGSRPDRSSRGLRVVSWVAAALAIASFPFAVWWLMGDVSTVPVSDDPDYMFRPPHIDPAVGRTVGTVAVTVFLVAIAIVAYATIRRSFTAQRWAITGPLLLSGFIVGAGERIMTAGVIGANIGGGFVLLFGTPLVAVGLAWSIGGSAYLRRRRAQAWRQRKDPPYPPWATPSG